MTTSARVLADSVSPNGDRLTTLEVTFPRFILAEFNTHRVFSRNSASSRAIPVSRTLERVERDPFVPEAFPVNRPGMSAAEYITEINDPERFFIAQETWLAARDAVVEQAQILLRHDVHKQIANRLLEPFMWHTVIVSSTEWGNFFDLRISEFAQPEIRETAETMRDAMSHSTPVPLGYGQWHLPLVDGDEWELDLTQKIRSSAARVAAVSYDRHHAKDYDKENARYELLSNNGHLSPFEHVATPSSDSEEWANFHGWRQVRWHIERSEPIRLD